MVLASNFPDHISFFFVQMMRLCYDFQALSLRRYHVFGDLVLFGKYGKCFEFVWLSGLECAKCLPE